MSMTLTLRRAEPGLLAGLDQDAAIAFALALEAPANADDVIRFFDLWHIVHFMSSGTEWDKTLPAGFMIGGEYWVSPHPDQEPFRLLPPEDVQAVDRHLGNLTLYLIDQRLHMLANGEASVYGPSVWEGDFPLFLSALNEIKLFVKSAAKRRESVTMAMT